MNEKELKHMVNNLRREIENRNKKINALYTELNIHGREAEELKIGRDTLNEKIRGKLEAARESTDKRNQLNEEISGRKKKRATLISDMKSRGSNIRLVKEERNKFNKAARGNNESLNELYISKMKILLEKDIPLDDEIKLFNRGFDIKKRLIASERAEELHKEVVDSYEKLKEKEADIQKINEEITSVAQESQKYHENAIEIYKKVDKIREEANKFHKKLMEKYGQMDLLRDKISEQREELTQLKKQIEPYDSGLKGIRSEREEKKKDKDIVKAKKKLQKKGRIGLDDLRLLLERNELRLDKKQ